MTTAHIKLVQAVYASFQQRDLVALTRLVSPEIFIRQSEQLPWGGIYRGLGEFQQFFAKLTEHIDSNLSFDNLIDAGDDVVAIGRTSGHVVKSGAPFDVPVVHVWSVRDGLIVSFQPYIDVPLMQASLRA
ncbi:MAG: hypothetical protein JWN04_4677 [Myxococcaceae bacterium]|nr:hypothetical protein [Myxococcaceae bacterium]